MHDRSANIKVTFDCKDFVHSTIHGTNSPTLAKMATNPADQARWARDYIRHQYGPPPWPLRIRYAIHVLRGQIPRRHMHHTANWYANRPKPPDYAIRRYDTDGNIVGYL